MPLNEGQLNELKHFYVTKRYPSLEEKKALGASLGLTLTRVEHWFKWQRAKDAKSQKKSVWLSQHQGVIAFSVDRWGPVIHHTLNHPPPPILSIFSAIFLCRFALYLWDNIFARPLPKSIPDHLLWEKSLPYGCRLLGDMHLFRFAFEKGAKLVSMASTKQGQKIVIWLISLGYLSRYHAESSVHIGLRTEVLSTR